jgi:hypothetical protein
LSLSATALPRMICLESSGCGNAAVATVLLVDDGDDARRHPLRDTDARDG